MQVVYRPELEFDSIFDNWNLEVPVFSSGEKGLRVLVVLDRVSTEEIAMGQVLAGDGRAVFENILKFLQRERGVKWGKILVLAWPFTSSSHKSAGALADLKKEATRRFEIYRKKFRPDRLLFLGPDLARNLLPLRLDQVDSCRAFGVVQDYQGIPATSSLSLFRMVQDPGSFWPNLLGFVVNHFHYLLLEKDSRFELDLGGYKCRILDSRKKFDRFLLKLQDASRVAVDLETENLSKFSNVLYTIQFCLDGKTAYVLPWSHPKSGFSAADLEYFRQKLAHYFEFGRSKFHIYAYGQFDLAQLQVQLGLRHYNHRIWDVQASAFALDENRKFLWHLPLKNDTVSTFPAYSLAQLALERGCAVYYDGTLKVGKADRENLQQVSLKKLALYGGYDAVISWQLQRSHQKEAESRGRPYRKFPQIVVEQIGSMILEFTEMEINGLNCDINYLLAQFHSNSALESHLRSLKQKLQQSPAVRKAEQKIRREKGIPETGMFGADPAFEIDKLRSQQLLFFDILGLKPLSERKDKKGYKIDKEFQQTYQDVKEVKYFTQYNKAKTLKNTFVKGFYRILQEDPDSRKSAALHPRFTYFSVVTGRSSAEKPSLQQIPARGELSGIIKRVFTPPPGEIIIKADYSAHEIRNWALVSYDKILSEAFATGLRARQAYREKSEISERSRKKWDLRFTASDVHRVNYSHFYQVPPETVTAEQRQNIKGVVFGVLYGKQAKSLAQDLKIEPQQAQELIDLLFSRFKSGGDWVKKTIEFGRKRGYVVSPHGRVRHLWGYLHPDSKLIGKMDRRGPNSIIQGISSDEGFIGGRALENLVWNLFVSQGQPFSLKNRNKVHDSTENTCAIIEAPLSCYLLEHAMTTIVKQKYEKIFDFSFQVGLEIEIGLGGSLNNIQTWDYRPEGILEILRKSLDWMQENLGYDLDPAQLLPDLEHNSKIVARLRQKELKNNSGKMLLTRKNARSLGFKFAEKARN